MTESHQFIATKDALTHISKRLAAHAEAGQLPLNNSPIGVHLRFLPCASCDEPHRSSPIILLGHAGPESFRSRWGLRGRQHVRTVGRGMVGNPPPVDKSPQQAVEILVHPSRNVHRQRRGVCSRIRIVESPPTQHERTVLPAAQRIESLRHPQGPERSKKIAEFPP